MGVMRASYITSVREPEGRRNLGADGRSVKVIQE
jgi:hypothetical protein